MNKTPNFVVTTRISLYYNKKKLNDSFDYSTKGLPATVFEK